MLEMDRLGRLFAKKNRGKSIRMQNKEIWYTMETERDGPPMPVKQVDEWTKFVDIMAGCRREEIVPAMWENVMKQVEATRSVLASYISSLSGGACMVFRGVFVMTLIVLIVMTRKLEKIMKRQEAAEAEPAEAAQEEAVTADAEPVEAEL